MTFWVLATFLFSALMVSKAPLFLWALVPLNIWLMWKELGKK